MWDNIIYVYLAEQNIVIPPKKESHKSAKYAGAFVKEPVPGLYDWVVNFDLNSLYPHTVTAVTKGTRYSYVSWVW